MKEPIWFQTILGSAQLAIGEPVGGLLWCDFRNLARAEITFGNVRSFDVEHFDGRVYRCIWIARDRAWTCVVDVNGIFDDRGEPWTSPVSRSKKP